RRNTDHLAVGLVAAAVRRRDARHVRAVRRVRCPLTGRLLRVRDVRIARRGFVVLMGHRLERRARRARVVAVADEIEAAADLAARADRGAAAELRQRVVDTAVHDRDRDAGAVEPELVLRDVRARLLHGVREIDLLAAAGTRVGKRHRWTGYTAFTPPT